MWVARLGTIVALENDKGGTWKGFTMLSGWCHAGKPVLWGIGGQQVDKSCDGPRYIHFALGVLHVMPQCGPNHLIFILNIRWWCKKPRLEIGFLGHVFNDLKTSLKPTLDVKFPTYGLGAQLRDFWKRRNMWRSAKGLTGPTWGTRVAA